MRQSGLIALRLAALLLGCTLLCSGCGRGKNEQKIDQIRVFSGAEQYALPGHEFAAPLVVTVNGPLNSGWFGGKGDRDPITRTIVQVIPDPGSGITVTPAEIVTDDSGAARFHVKAGQRTGDHYLRIVPEDAPELATEVRFTVGAAISGCNQEAAAGAMAPEPIRIHLANPDGSPAAGVPVYFRLTSSPTGGLAGAEVFPEVAETDAEGTASAQVKLGSESGEYVVGLEVADPESGLYIRQLPVRLLALDLVSILVNVIGGLALFIFGMKLMSDGLLKIAGDRMKKILHYFSRNGVVAVLAGTAVTAVIQSSGATTIMVIGFLNAGMLNLTQAIGIIFGANIGTTVTAQIISFDLSALAMPLIVIGLVTMFIGKRRWRGWGEGIFGFGLLFYGLGVMCGELKVLGELPSFQHFFASFNCAPHDGVMPILPVLGAIGVGVLLTVALQSSSAAMGVVLALAAGGLVDFYTSIPLILGSNIGTTTVAVFASLAANRTAKQAAMAHFLFNFIGTILMLLGFYIPWGPERRPIFLAFINSITPGDVFAEIPQNLERHIAMAHTMFNVVVTVLLMPFIKPFAQLCCRLVPTRNEGHSAVTILEPHLLSTPSAALEQVVVALRSMVKDAWSMIDVAVNVQFVGQDLSDEYREYLDKTERKTDQMQLDVTSYLVRITRQHNLSEHQSELIPLLMHCNNDAERIADHAANILALAERLNKSDKKLSNASLQAIATVWDLLNNEASCVLEALGSVDREKVAKALKSERKLNRLTDELEQESIERLRTGHCYLVNSVIYIELLGELEKIGDRLTNIAERTPEIQKHYLSL